MKRIVLLLFIALTLCGCAQRVELAFMAVCLGVDVDANGVTLTVKCPDYAGDRKEQNAGYTTLSVTGEDWPRAVAALYAACPVTPQFSQLREIVIGETGFAFTPPGRLLDLIDQLPGVRVHALVTVSPGPAAAMVERLQPEIGKRLSKYLDISLRHYEQQGAIPATSLSCALRDLGSPWRDPVLAFTDGENYAGAYALGPEGALRLTPEETQLYRLIRGESQALLLERGGRYFGAANRGRVKRKIEDDTMILELPVYITYGLADPPPDAGASETLAGKTRALIARLRDAGCDALGFGCEAARGFSTLDAWLQSDWRERYKRMNVRVEVDARPRAQPVL